MPGQEELAMGAIAEANVQILDEELIQQLSISRRDIERVLQKESKELERRLAFYRHGKSLVELNNKTIILVDDGIATGSTIKAAIIALRSLHAKK